MDKGFSAKMGADKGQLISKCPFGIFKSPKKELRKRSNQKNKGTLVTLYHFIFKFSKYIGTTSTTQFFLFDLVLEARAEILTKIS